MTKKRGLAKIMMANAKPVLFVFLSVMIVLTMSMMTGINPIGQSFLDPTIPTIPTIPTAPTTMSTFSTTSSTTTIFTGIAPDLILPDTVAYGSSATVEAACAAGDNCELDSPLGTFLCASSTPPSQSSLNTCSISTSSSLPVGTYTYYAIDLSSSNVISGDITVVDVYAEFAPDSQGVISGTSNTYSTTMICAGPNSSCYSGDIMLSNSGCPSGAAFDPSSVTNACPSDLSQLSGYCQLNNFASSSGNLNVFNNCGLSSTCYSISGGGEAYDSNLCVSQPCGSGIYSAQFQVCGYFQAQGSSAWLSAVSPATLTLTSGSSAPLPTTDMYVAPGQVNPPSTSLTTSATVDSGSYATFMLTCNPPGVGIGSQQCVWPAIIISDSGSCPSGNGAAWSTEQACGSQNLDQMSINNPYCLVDAASTWPPSSGTFYPYEVVSQVVNVGQTTTLNVCGYACNGVCSLSTGQQSWTAATQQASLTVIGTGGNPLSLAIGYDPVTQTSPNQVTFTAQCNNPLTCGSYVEIDDIGPGGTCQNDPYSGPIFSGGSGGLSSCTAAYSSPGIGTTPWSTCEVGFSHSVYVAPTLTVTDSGSGAVTDTICAYAQVAAIGPTGVTCDSSGCWALQTAQLTLNPSGGPSGGSGSGGTLTPALQAICNVYYVVNAIVFILALTLMILGGALYAGAQILPGQSRGMVQGYAMGLVFGGVAGAIIAMLAPFVLSIAYNSPANIISAVCTSISS